MPRKGLRNNMSQKLFPVCNLDRTGLSGSGKGVSYGKLCYTTWPQGHIVGPIFRDGYMWWQDSHWAFWFCGEAAWRMGMNGKNIFMSDSNWQVGYSVSFKNKVVGSGVFLLLGCTGSHRCPKHPPSRGIKRPRPHPHFFLFSSRPCKDIFLTIKCREHVLHLSQHCLYAGWISGSCPISSHKICKYFLNSGWSQHDVWKRFILTVISASMLLFKIHSHEKWKRKPPFEPPPTNWSPYTDQQEKILFIIMCNSGVTTLTWILV